jgi:hypothetical protein
MYMGRSGEDSRNSAFHDASPRYGCQTCSDLQSKCDALRTEHEAAARALRDRVNTASAAEYAGMKIVMSDAGIDWELSKFQMAKHCVIHQKAN